MKKILKGLGMLGLAAVLPMTMVTPAHAINVVSCDNYGYTHVRGNGGPVCFANEGRTETWITGVYQIWGGNSQGSVRASDGKIYEFKKKTDRNLGGHYTIKVVRIDHAD